MSKPVAVVGAVGASVRSAVMSLARAGFSAWAVDLFADRDLARIAPCVRCPVEDYPAGIPALAEQFPPGPVLYTGGLENHPEVVRELAARRPLWGNGPDVLDRVRDPYWLSDSLHGMGFGYPHLLPRGEPCPVNGRWLLKKCRSSGGLGVRVARPGEIPGPESYLQEFIPGPPMSAVFVADQPKCRLIGVTEQLIGTPWLHAAPFHYAGTLGPVELDSDRTSELTLLGNRLMVAAGVKGVFGVDFIPYDGGAWVVIVEVNPRYPASVEVLEVAGGIAAFQNPSPGPPPKREGRKTRAGLAPPSFPGKGAGGLGPCVVGKAVYYAPHPITFPAAGPWDADLAGPFDPWRLPAFADIPAAGERIEAGSPVLTVFVSGSTPDECRGRLQSRAAELDQLFGHDQSGPVTP